MCDFVVKYPNDNYVKLYRLAKINLEGNNLEIAMMLSCIVIESISHQKYKDKELLPFDWLIKNNFDVNKFKDLGNLKEEYYKENISCSEKFAKIVIDTYTCLQKFPNFLYKKNTKIKISEKLVTHTSLYYPDKDKLKENLHKEMKFIYSKYRSKFCHIGENLPQETKLRSKYLFGISRPGAVTIQDILEITSDVIKYYYEHIK